MNVNSLEKILNIAKATRGKGMEIIFTLPSQKEKIITGDRAVNRFFKKNMPFSSLINTNCLDCGQDSIPISSIQKVKISDIPIMKERTRSNIGQPTTLIKLVNLRSRAFDMANSGKYGDYPFDETFNDEVEKGFNDDGTSWTAKNGTTITI